MTQRTATVDARGQAVRIRLPRAQIATPIFPASLASYPSFRTIFAELVPAVAPARAMPEHRPKSRNPTTGEKCGLPVWTIRLSA